MPVDAAAAAMAERLQVVTIGPVHWLDGPVRLDPPKPEWPRLFAREAARIRRVLRGLVAHIKKLVERA
jgi:GrpB-like predicted nucleotidyltransferase (UPF0157 family)